MNYNKPTMYNGKLRYHTAVPFAVGLGVGLLGGYILGTSIMWNQKQMGGLEKRL